MIEAFPAFFMSFERNEQKCGNGFLKTALSRALPNGVGVFFSCAVLQVLAPYFGIAPEESVLFQYLSVGFFSLLGVFGASRPLTLFRGSLAAGAALGFVGAILCFPSLLQLPRLSLTGIWILPLVLACAMGAKQIAAQLTASL